MFVSDCGVKAQFRILFFGFLAMLCCALFAAPGYCQQTSSPTALASGAETAKTDIDKAKQMGTQPAAPPPVLQQLNSAIEQLTARISPAVVQILVTGYGAVDDSSRRSNGADYPRASDRFRGDRRPQRLHHDECARGRRSAAHPCGAADALDRSSRADRASGQATDSWKRDLIGFHKETDLALLKIDETGLPTLSLGGHSPCTKGNWCLPWAVLKDWRTL